MDKERDKDKDGDEDNVKGKKPTNRIESSSESSSSSDSSGSSDSSSSSDEDDETASQTEKSGKSEGEPDKEKEKKKKQHILSSVVGTKRKGEELTPSQPAKKRGRPLGSVNRPRETESSGIATPPIKVAEPTSSTAGSVVTTPAVTAVASAPPPPVSRRLPPSPHRAVTPGLPPLSIPSNPHYTQIKTTEDVFNLNSKESKELKTQRFENKALNISWNEVSESEANMMDFN